MLSAQDIFGADDLKPQEVKVPEWGGTVLVGVMTGEERDQWEIGLMQDKSASNKQERLQNVRAKLAILVCRDAEGNRLFKEEDVTRLGKKSSAALQRIFNVAKKINRIGDDDVEELAKN